MDLITKARNLAIEKYILDLDGLHALAHWDRVRENGIFLSKWNKADRTVVELFAVLHDSCRENESIDPEHGARAAAFIDTLFPHSLHITINQLNLLKEACIGHNKGYVSDNDTIGTCWDADRLDLGRVGIYPDLNFMSTTLGKHSEVIDLCYENSIGYDRSFEELNIVK